MRQVLHHLETSYHSPVDTEFTLNIARGDGGKPHLTITLLQCRPLAHLVDTAQVPWPVELPRQDIIFLTRFVVPQGYVPRVDYVMVVEPRAYFRLPSEQARHELKRAIGRLNAALAQQSFICVGPGRWGSSNSDLGVPIDYGDVYHCKALVELAGAGIAAPEPSLGTHFFQDLMEAQIYPLAIVLDDPQTIFNHPFFEEMPNRACDWIEIEESLEDCLRLVRVSDYRPGTHLALLMSDDKGQAIGYLEKDDGPSGG